MSRSVLSNFNWFAHVAKGLQRRWICNLHSLQKEMMSEVPESTHTRIPDRARDAHTGVNYFHRYNKDITKLRKTARNKEWRFLN
mmetsp:Transcript_8837/g.11253  ORF Transcript_8837/g.11253 Transcript_8837/m.11253 type:complete len:84 (-) Transcript_8837:625-876(-)